MAEMSNTSSTSGGLFALPCALAGRLPSTDGNTTRSGEGETLLLLAPVACDDCLFLERPLPLIFKEDGKDFERFTV